MLTQWGRRDSGMVRKRSQLRECQPLHGPSARVMPTMGRARTWSAIWDEARGAIAKSRLGAKLQAELARR